MTMARPVKRLRLFTAAIGARHRITHRFHIKAGSVEAETLAQAQNKALDACYKKFPSGVFDDQQANVQNIPEAMLSRQLFIDASSN